MSRFLLANAFPVSRFAEKIPSHVKNPSIAAPLIVSELFAGPLQLGTADSGISAYMSDFVVSDHVCSIGKMCFYIRRVEHFA